MKCQVVRTDSFLAVQQAFEAWHSRMTVAQRVSAAASQTQKRNFSG